MPGSPHFGQGTFGESLFGGTRNVQDKTLMDIVRQILDQTAGDVFWSPQQLYDAANEVLIDLWANVKPQVGTTPVVVRPGDDIVVYDTNTIMIPQFLVLST